LLIGWHAHPSDPAPQVVGSTAPEAPAGIWHFPETQTPLAQSGPVAQVVFGSITLGSQSPPVHLPLWQSVPWVHAEPAWAPELAPPFVAPPPDVDPPAPDPPTPDPPIPPSIDPWHTPATHCRLAQSFDAVHFPPAEVRPLWSLELQAKAATPTRRNPKSPTYPRCCL
jgi:hypothetical protein